MRIGLVCLALAMGMAACGPFEFLTEKHKKRDVHWHEHEHKVHESKKGI